MFALLLAQRWHSAQNFIPKWRTKSFTVHIFRQKTTPWQIAKRMLKLKIVSILFDKFPRLLKFPKVGVLFGTAGGIPHIYVRGPFWVWISWIARPTGRELHFRMGMIRGTILSWFLVFYFIVPGCSGTVPESVRI